MLKIEKMTTCTPVWRYFKKIPGTTMANCQMCVKQYSYKTSITNLKKHLKYKHAQEYHKILQSSNKPNVIIIRNETTSTSERLEDNSPQPDTIEAEDEDADKDSPIKVDYLDEDYFSKTTDSSSQNEENSHTEPEQRSEEAMVDEETYLDEDIFCKYPTNNKLGRVDQFPGRNTLSKTEWEGSIDRFGSYVASLMKLLPRKKAAKFQVQIIERLIKESFVS